MLYLREADVRAVLTMPDAVRCVEEAFRRQGLGEMRGQPRSRVRFPDGTLNVLPAVDLTSGVAGVKTYIAVRGAFSFVVLLFDLDGGALLAMIEADYLGMMRTGAASGVATRHLAAAGPHRLAVIGTGWQGRGQVEGVLSACEVSEVRAFSRRPEQREAFARQIENELGVTCIASALARDAVAGATVICTATNTATPVLEAADVSDGAHINAAGSNSLVRREIDNDLVRRAGTIVVDSRVQARAEAGDLLAAHQLGWLDLDALPELGEVVAGLRQGRRTAEEITIFESLGLGTQDVAVAAHVYRQALAAGLGDEIATSRTAK
jgi:ornithine cyclodeaminase/alanine dehydrogenase-like protein (mu-crystallin family)